MIMVVLVYISSILHKGTQSTGECKSLPRVPAHPDSFLHSAFSLLISMAISTQSVNVTSLWQQLLQGAILNNKWRYKRACVRQSSPSVTSHFTFENDIHLTSLNWVLIILMAKKGKKYHLCKLFLWLFGFFTLLFTRARTKEWYKINS